MSTPKTATDPSAPRHRRGHGGSGEAATRNGVVYVLRSFPELSETFIRSEMDGLSEAGVPVSVVALRQAEPTGVTGVAAGAGPAVVYVTGPRAARPSGRRRAGGLSRLARPVLRDVLRLRGHPRRTARCLRLARHAVRAAAWVPAGTRRLHAHFANDAAALARYVSRLTGVPYVVTAHAYDIYRDPFLLRPNLAGAAHVLTVSEANRRHLETEVLGSEAERGRVSVLHCGVDLAAFVYRDPPAPRAPMRLLSVARLVPKKGHDVLIDAVARLVGAGLPVRLTIAGDGPLIASLRRRAADRGLRGAVELLGGVPPDRIPGMMREADAMVLAARIADDGDRDGIPVALIEASASGVPVVATDVSGIPELVTRESGWLVPPERPDLFADTLQAALTEPDARRKDRTRLARRRVEEAFDLRKQIEFLRAL